MCFKGSYRLTVGIDDSTYSDDETAVNRIWKIYETTRQGRLSNQRARSLWLDFFKPLLPLLNKLPSKQKSFDEFVIKKIVGLSKSKLLPKSQKGKFGIAQKVFNLFMKDQWALDKFLNKSELESLLHLPLDRGLLKKLTDCSWIAFTKVKTTEKSECEYLCIQKRYRDYWRRVGIFSSPIEMEQFIWQQI